MNQSTIGTDTIMRLAVGEVAVDVSGSISVVVRQAG